MVVCGDDALAYRLTAELARLYEQHVTVVVPSAQGGNGLRISELAHTARLPVTVREAAEPSEAALMAAGVQHAQAVALTYTDDQMNIHAALRARRINPSVRLVIRLFNRKLGHYLEDLLARAVRIAQPGAAGDATTTVLSDADTAAPALVAAALAGQRSRIVEADGLLLRAADRMPGDPVAPTGAGDELCTLAMMSDFGGADRRDDTPSYTPLLEDFSAPPGSPGQQGPLLLPDDDDVRASSAVRGRVVLEAVTRQEPQSLLAAPLNRIPRGLPLRELFSRRLMLAVAGLVGLEGLYALLTWQATSNSLIRSAYLTMLDMMAMGNPATGEHRSRQILQLLSALTGLAMLPVLFAVVLQAFDSFRNATASCSWASAKSAAASSTACTNSVSPSCAWNATPRRAAWRWRVRCTSRSSSETPRRTGCWRTRSSAARRPSWR
jgi:hypothetical protein